MKSLDVARLQRVSTYPAVSLLLPIDGQPRDHVRLRLRGLASETVGRLLQEFDPTEIQPLIDRLFEAVDTVEISLGQQGVAIYVGDHATTMALSVPVRERVVVDNTFATRDLVRALQRSPRYCVVTVGPKVMRLYQGVGFTLTEVQGGGFPATVPNTDSSQGRRAARTGVSKRGVDLNQFVRTFDDAITPYLRSEPQPVVLVGGETRVRFMTRRSRHRLAIAGTVRGANDFPRQEDLARLAWPTIENHLREDVSAAVIELEASNGGSRFASGVDEIWTLAQHGRGDLLLVEEGFEYPARIDERSGHVVPAEDREAPDVIDDLVDEIIEVVLAKRGRCHIVADGSLTGHGRIAMKLRY